MYNYEVPTKTFEGAAKIIILEKKTIFLIVTKSVRKSHIAEVYICPKVADTLRSLEFF